MFENEFLKIIDNLISKGVSAAAIETACDMPKTKISKIRRGDAKPKKTEYQKLLIYLEGFEGITAERSNIVDEGKNDDTDKKALKYVLNYIELEKKVNKLESEMSGKIKDLESDANGRAAIEQLKAFNKRLKELKDEFNL